MITPSFAPTATERILPAMALDFTTASLDARVTVTRAANTATRTNASGALEVVNANLPRFDYNPTTLVCNGLLIEEGRSNYLLNSLIDGTNLSTQSVTTSAVAYTLSFYGTGNIVLSGTSSATVTGTGAYPFRKTYTFTPTAGSLTLTVSGTVQYAQLEIGAFATSFIPTAGAAVGRNPDVVKMTGTNFSNWFNASTGCFRMQGQFISGANTEAGSFRRLFAVSDNTTNNTMQAVALGGTNIIRFEELIAGVFSAFCNTATTPSGAFGFTAAYRANNQAIALNGTAPALGTRATLPTVSQLDIGQAGGGIYQMCGTIAKLSFYKQYPLNAEVQAFSKG